MRGWTVTLLLCALGAACAKQPGQQPRNPELESLRWARLSPARVTRSLAGRAARAASTASADSADRWNQLIAEYMRGALAVTGGAGAGSWFPQAFPVQVPLQADNNGRATLSVLVVPVPVAVPLPVPAPAQYQPNAQQTAATPLDQRTQTLPATNDVPVTTYAPSITTGAATTTSAPSEAPPARPTPPAPIKTTSVPRPPQHRPPPRDDERLARDAPNFPAVEDSQFLVEQFRAQTPTDPTLPPIVTDPVGVASTDDFTVEELRETGSVPNLTDGSAGITQGSRERRRLKCKRRTQLEGELDPGAPGLPPPPPPPPRFERSLFLRARLTVPRADYTETYSVWWDAASGASRVDFHGGSTSTYRMMKRDGRMQSVLIRVDRTEEEDVRRCVVTPPRRVSLAERALPALPDLQAFSFAGYVFRGTERAERWRHTLSGHSGELGGARGEALTFRHELLVTRSADNYTTTPLWYSVRVDSSALGPDCDGYVHYFDEVQTRHHDSSMFHLDIADACEQVVVTDRMENVEPLREYTMLRRDPRYDAEIEQYKRTFQRTYADDLEEAVRKNVFVQSSRHTASGNRQGASFELATNFLSDRLVVEQSVLLGVQRTLGADPGEPFPHPGAELEALRGRLPRKFDWRERGAVTAVRNQWLCSSCWAFATVGAVEGALFVESGRLVPLSEQVLVDCAGPYGGNGCKGTWPSAAYNYVKENGLPALQEYTPYKSQELQCRADSVPPVTRISGHLNVTANNILALKVAIKRYGPTLVIVDAKPTTFATYKKSYYHDARCRRDSPNHAVLAVGWTVHRGETYFIVKNSYSTAWGEEGYMRIRAATNTCGVLRWPSLPRLRASDVLRVPAAAPSGAIPPNT